MKKFVLFILSLYLFPFCIYGQENKEIGSDVVWLMRYGGGFSDCFGGERHTDAKIFGYNISFEFNHYLAEFSYWGINFAVGSRGCKRLIKDDAYYIDRKYKWMAHAIQVNPFRGWQLPIINEKLIFDFHFGPYFSMDMGGIYSYRDYGATKLVSIFRTDGYKRFDCGVDLSCGIWINRKVSFDVLYQQGFVEMVNCKKIMEDGYYVAHNLIFRIGYTY